MRTLIAAAAALAILAGCSSQKTVTTANGTTVTTDTSGQTVTVKSNQGTFTEGKNVVNAASLGLPVYPASTADTAGYAANTAQGNGQVDMLTTTDPFDKVYAWYQGHMPAGTEKMHMTAGGTDEAMFQIGADTDKIQKIVTITSSQGKTMIELAAETKN
jgi:hypothetical protein